MGHRNLHVGPAVCHFNGETRSFEELGMKNVEIEDRSNTSAYHIPQGALLIYDPRNRHLDQGPRTQISTLDIMPAILKQLLCACSNLHAAGGIFDDFARLTHCLARLIMVTSRSRFWDHRWRKSL